MPIFQQRMCVSFPLTILLISVTSVSAEVIWRGDFETGTTEQWKSPPKNEGVKVVTDPVREGKFALRIDGTNAARRGKLDRIEFQHQPLPPGTAEGTERYFGWSVFVPKKLTDDFHSVGYFETRTSWRQLMAFEVHGEDIVYSTRVPYARRWTGKGKLTPGRWHDFAVHVLWSRDPKRGFVEIWFDGEQVVPLTKTATLLDENAAFFQVGFMRNTSDVPEAIIFDHVVEATTLAEVTPPPLPTARVSLWSDRAPNGDGTFEKSGLELKAFLPPPEKATGAAMVLCPGGGYIRHMVNYSIIDWLSANGIATILLEYRLPEGRSKVPLFDAQRALRITRAKAKEWKIDPKRVGILGFSAGGHVASSAATHFDSGRADDADPIERQSCRPDFTLLIYPVITMGDKAHAGSKAKLLGTDPKPALVRQFSNETQVTRESPPAFVTHALDDTTVPVENSRMFVDALKNNNVPVEYLELPSGGHGLNGNKGPMWEKWKTESLKWLVQRKVIAGITASPDSK
ncbi:MAG: heparin lyase I family protein [Planctomycetes bacterium]|nr:heparin lyase I family protein [Planctomycetota bacterium]